MKKTYWIIIVIIVIVLFFMIFRFGGEDSWIKNEKGIYVKHGNPSSMPENVAEQNAAISCARSLYMNARNNMMDFSSQCLGRCMDYAIDIVHVPRSDEDNLAENQCSDFREGRVSKFIELNQNGEVVRVG